MTNNNPSYIPSLLKKGLEKILNISQIKAVQEVTTSTNAFSLIIGPPGTGKTQTTIGLLSVFL